MSWRVLVVTATDCIILVLDYPDWKLAIKMIMYVRLLVSASIATLCSYCIVMRKGICKCYKCKHLNLTAIQ